MFIWVEPFCERPNNKPVVPRACDAPSYKPALEFTIKLAIKCQYHSPLGISTY
jgi:hypothetical protein